LLLLLWLFYPLQMFPSLGEVVRALGGLLTGQGLIQELWASLTTALGALALATVLALLISYLTALPFFRPLAYAASKMRYLTLTGLTFFMALMLSSGHQVKLAVLVFGATVYLVTGMTSVILSTSQRKWTTPAPWAWASGAASWRWWCAANSTPCSKWCARTSPSSGP
jgi:NitT/TauT family transport system permease protein